MKNPLSLRSRLALLAALFALAAGPAYGTAVSGFNTAPTITYPTDATYPHTAGGLAGAPLTVGTSGISGVTFTTTAGGALTQTQTGNATVPVAGVLTAFTLSGSALGTVGSTSNVFSGHYNFTIATAAALPNTVTITGWTLTDGITTNTGTATGTATGTGTGTFVGTIQFALSGTSLTSYTSMLTINYLVSGTGTTITTTVPTGSIDLGLVPEPGTWAMVGLGIAGAGVRWARRRGVA